MRRTLTQLTRLLTLLVMSEANAGLIGPTVNADTLFNLDISWGWNPEDPDFSLPSLTNWNLDLEISRSLGSWEVAVRDLQHKTNPHPELSEFIGTTTSITGSFSNLNDFGLVITETKSVPHGSVHEDTYTFTFNRSTSPSNTVIRLREVIRRALLRRAASLISKYCPQKQMCVLFRSRPPHYFYQ
jgi:hypothetical protein